MLEALISYKRKRNKYLNLNIQFRISTASMRTISIETQNFKLIKILCIQSRGRGPTLMVQFQAMDNIFPFIPLHSSVRKNLKTSSIFTSIQMSTIDLSLRNSKFQLNIIIMRSSVSISAFYLISFG